MVGPSFAPGNLKRAEITNAESTALRWHHSSPEVRRGFCTVCGSSLFCDPIQHDLIALAMGALDQPSGRSLAKHIFIAGRGDYYTLNGGLEQSQARWRT